MPNEINKYDAEGQQHGPWERYFDNGQLWYIGEYIHNNFDGYWVEYFKNGQLAYKGTFKNGEEIGYAIDYYHDGDIITKRFYAR